MSKRQIKAIFFDIDGTLRDFETKRIPESTKEALRKAREAGILPGAISLRSRRRTSWRTWNLTDTSR